MDEIATNSNVDKPFILQVRDISQIIELIKIY